MKAKGARNPAKAARVANAVYRVCLAGGGSDKTCAPKAIRIALSQTNNPLKRKAK